MAPSRVKLLRNRPATTENDKPILRDRPVRQLMLPLFQLAPRSPLRLELERLAGADEPATKAS